MEPFPSDLGRPVRVPVTDKAWLALGLAVGLGGLGAAVFAIADPADRDAVLMRIVAGALIVFALAFAGLAGFQLSGRPRLLVLDADTVTVPGLPVWRGPRTVAWREVVGLGELPLAQVGLALSFQLASGERLNVPFEAIQATSTTNLIARILARMRRAAYRDPVSTTAGWEALFLREGNGAAVVADGELVVWEPDVGAYARNLGSYPANHVLVLDRPAPGGSVGVDPTTLGAALDLIAELGPPGRLNRRNLALFAAEGVYELFSFLRGLVLDPDQRTWPDAIRGHFERLALAQAEGAELMARARDLDAVRASLRIELEDRSRLQPSVVSRPLGADVHAVLVFDHRTGTSPVGRDLAEGWNVPDADLFAIAVENLRAVAPPARIERGAFEARVGDDCTSARVLLDVADGAVVAVPSRNVLMVMCSVLALMVAGPMLLEAQTVFARASRPVRPELFVWWRGEFVPIAVQPNPQGGITFVPRGDIVSEALKAMSA